MGLLVVVVVFSVVVSWDVGVGGGGGGEGGSVEPSRVMRGGTRLVWV